MFFSPTMAVKGEKMPFLNHETYYNYDPVDLDSKKQSEFHKMTNLNSFDIDINNLY